MVQVLKEGVRSRIARAAEARFAEVGFRNATIGEIAGAAGVATGTVYKYFPDKETLFLSIITADFVAEMSRLTRLRIAAFARPGGMDADRDPAGGESGDLLRFFARNRLKVVILLGRCAGTKYADFAPDYLREMEAQALEQARAQFPGLAMTRVFRFMARHILGESIRGIVAILTEFDDEASIGEALSAAVGYQVAGMNALMRRSLGEGESA